MQVPQSIQFFYSIEKIWRFASTFLLMQVPFSSHSIEKEQAYILELELYEIIVKYE